MKRVLLDLTPLVTKSSLRGIGRYVRGLVRGLAELGADAELEVLGASANARVNGLELVRDTLGYSRRPVEPPLGNSGSRRDRLMAFAAPRLAREEGALLHLTEPTGFPFSGKLGHCLTCHDLIPLVMHREYLSKWPGAYRYNVAIERARYARARRVLAVSHASKRDLAQQLQLAEDKIDVVWHGVDHDVFHPAADAGELERVRALLGDASPYVLYVGAGDPRKDLSTLLRAFADSRLAREARLVIAGQLRPKRVKELRELAEARGVAQRFSLAGYVADSMIPALYRHASVHAFPSRYEGFGFPVIEAMACGTPTITSPNSSLDEVAGDAALIVPCHEPEALASALERAFFESELRASLREKGLARAAGFTWRACAEQTLAFWKRALSA